MHFTLNVCKNQVPRLSISCTTLVTCMEQSTKGILLKSSRCRAWPTEQKNTCSSSFIFKIWVSCMSKTPELKVFFLHYPNRDLVSEINGGLRKFPVCSFHLRLRAYVTRPSRCFSDFRFSSKEAFLPQFYWKGLSFFSLHLKLRLNLHFWVISFGFLSITNTALPWRSYEEGRISKKWLVRLVLLCPCKSMAPAYRNWVDDYVEFDRPT